MNFAKLSVKARLLSLIGVVVVGLCTLSAVFLLDARTQLLEEKKTKLRNIVEVALGIAEHYQSMEKSGTLNREEAQARARHALRSMRYDTSEYVWVNDMHPRMVMHPIKPELDGKDLTENRDPAGKALFVEFVRVVQATGAGFVDYQWSKPGFDTPVPKVSFVKGFPAWGWVIGSGIYIDDVATQFNRAAVKASLIALTVLAILSALGFMISRGIIRQLGGEPAFAADVTRDIAAGNLMRQQVADTGRPDSLLAALTAMQTRLAEIFRGIQDASTRLSAAAEAVSLASGESSTATHNQAQSSAAMAASIEQMTVSINEVSELSKLTEIASGKVAQLCATGEQQVAAAERQMGSVASTVRGASDKVKELMRRSEEIGNIANVIKEIADQTNLLALNAAIEAARAGETGRGFAVVADEVRKLAERTANATTEISGVIGAVQCETQSAVEEMGRVLPQVEEGSRLSQEASATLQTIHHESNDSLGRVRDVASAAREQAVTANQIAREVESIAQMAEEVSSTMANTAENAHDMESIALNLKQQIAYFRI